MDTTKLNKSANPSVRMIGHQGIHQLRSMSGMWTRWSRRRDCCLGGGLSDTDISE